jgi:Cys-tRNA(Pro) deacylase
MDSRDGHPRPPRDCDELPCAADRLQARRMNDGVRDANFVQDATPACLDNPPTMAKKDHVSETPATQALRQHRIAFSEHIYDYVEHGGTTESARQLGVDEHHVVKTLVMEDEAAKPLIVLMHGDRQVSTKNLARQIAAKKISPCKPEVAQRHSGFMVGGTSPFGTRKAMPVYVESTVLELPLIYINGGRRGYLVGISPRVLTELLDAKPVQCAGAE